MASQLTGGKRHSTAQFGLRSSSKLDLSSNSDVARSRVRLFHNNYKTQVLN